MSALRELDDRRAERLNEMDRQAQYPDRPFTQQAPASVLALMAGTKSATASRKKGDIPRIIDSGLLPYTDSNVRQSDCKSTAMEALAGVTAFPLLDEFAKDVEQLKAQCRDRIIAIAEPIRLEHSRKWGEHLSSVKVNGVRYTCSPPNYQVRLPDDALLPTCQAFGESRFMEYFEPVAVPGKEVSAQAIKDALLAAGIPCVLGWKPTKAFHEARTINPAVADLAATVCPSIQPTQFVVGK